MTQINSDLRTTLNEQAREYYSAHKENDRDRINDICKTVGIDTHGFDCLGSGSGRIVFDMEILGYSHLALKMAVPNNRYDGLKQNKREFDVWRSKSNSSQKERLVEVLDSGPDKYWIIMRKGENCGEIPYEWKRNTAYILDELVWDEDIKDENIVKVNGSYKLCDYGTPKK